VSEFLTELGVNFSLSYIRLNQALLNLQVHGEACEHAPETRPIRVLQCSRDALAQIAIEFHMKFEIV